MSVIVLLIAAGGTVAAAFLCAFAWAVQSGQFDDTCTPAVRVLLDEPRREDRKTRREDRKTGRREDGKGANADADH